MNNRYVAFTPDIDKKGPAFDDHLQKITEEITAYVRQSRQINNISYSTRDAHAKGYAAVQAEFSVMADLPPEFAQGLYAKPGNHEAVIRFSNGSARISSDKLSGLSMGMAIKLLGVNETGTAGDNEAPNFDYNLINSPTFFCNSADHYVYISHLVLQAGAYFARGFWGILTFIYQWLTGMGTCFPTRQSLNELFAFFSFRRIKPDNVLLHNYYTIGAMRHGDYIARLRAIPVHEYADRVTRRHIDMHSAEQVFGPTLIAELQEHTYEFAIQVQLCTDLKRMPIDDLTKEWDQALSPFVTVARLHIPQQDVSGSENFDIMEQLSFAPFRCPDAHRPLGNLQLTRKEAYRQSSMLRHQLNGREHREPKNLADIFGKSPSN